MSSREGSRRYCGHVHVHFRLPSDGVRSVDSSGRDSVLATHGASLRLWLGALPLRTVAQHAGDPRLLLHALGRHLGATAGEGDLPRGPQVGDDLLHQGIVRLATPLGQHRLDALAEHPDQLLLPVVVAIPQVDESTLGPEGTGDATLHGASLVAAEVVLLDEVLLVRHLCFFLLIWNVQVVDPFQGVQRLTAITTVQGESGGSPLHHLSDTPTDD